jgi:hypothetical protein
VRAVLGLGSRNPVRNCPPQPFPWLRPLGLVEGFCPPPPLRARFSLRAMGDYSEGQFDDESDHIFAVNRDWRLDTVLLRHSHGLMPPAAMPHRDQVCTILRTEAEQPRRHPGRQPVCTVISQTYASSCVCASLNPLMPPFFHS